MVRAWLDLWKKTLHFGGTVSRKEYWLALIGNVIAMYIGVIPYALIVRELTDQPAMAIAVYLIAVHLPVLSLYFRRGRDAGWKTGTALYLAVVMPGISALLVGAIRRCAAITGGHSLVLKLLALSFGLFFYGSIVSVVIYDDVTAMPGLPIAGLLLASAILIGYGIVNWRQVVAVLAGRGES